MLVAYNATNILCGKCRCYCGRDLTESEVAYVMYSLSLPKAKLADAWHFTELLMNKKGRAIWR